MSFATALNAGYFLAGAVMSFAILLPLVIPLAHSLGLPLPVSIGAVLAAALLFTFLSSAARRE